MTDAPDQPAIEAGSDDLAPDLRSPDLHTLDRLYAVIAGRRGADPDQSYTAKLFARGTGKIAQKLGEEAVEAVIEAVRLSSGTIEREAGLTALASESADLLYHLLVLWADAGLDPARVWTALESRRGTSGLDEKKSRSKR